MTSVDEPKAKILVADDDDLISEVLETYLTMENYGVRVAYSGESALEMIAEDRPDLILLDARMGDLSGFEVCKRLKADPETRQIPVAMITALDDKGDKQNAIEAGVDDFIAKPFDPIVMLNRVKCLLRTKRLTDSLDSLLKQHTDEATASTILQALRLEAI